MRAASALLVAAALPASAQDYNATPNYGTVTLRTGFTPDPHNVNLRAGGDRSAQERVGSACRGFITNTPDVRLNYTAGDTFPLIISVAAQADTTLVVNGPDGRWYCNDDGGNGLNPSLRFDHPASGRYEIWVGTYASGATRPAQLSISEVTSR